MPIPYGERWGMDSPPEETYSVVSHPERFAPLLEVAKALRAHLLETYDVTEDGDRLTPADLAAAPLEIELTDFPGVRVRAGFAGSMGAPGCGCDACDEGLEESAEELERYVFAVVAGRYQERLDGKWVTIETWDEQGSGRSEGSRNNYSKDVIAALRRHGTWKPWPLRSGPGTS